MPIDCTSANLSQQEKTLCTCKLATDAMVKTLKVYETLSTNYTSDKTAYDREKKRHDQWRNMSGEFANWATRKKQLIDERKNTNSWACEGASWDGRGGWCSNDHGGDWEFDHHSKDSWQVCSWTHKCRRKGDAINRILRDEGYNRAEPNVPGIPQSPQFNSQNTIQCCSQVFSNISVEGGAAEFSGINQNCQQQLNNELNKPTPTSAPEPSQPSQPTSAPTSAPTSEPTSEPTSTTIQENKQKQFTNQNMIIIIIIIVILFLSLSCSSISGIFLINTDE